MDCRQRFIGCSCKGEGPSCCSSKACLCYDSGRECDPDVCTSCGADNAESKSCLNVAIQRELSKSLSVKPSSVHGWGAFAEETVEKGDFICEYIGELITKDVGEKRGIKYAELKSNYIFSLDNGKKNGRNFFRLLLLLLSNSFFQSTTLTQLRLETRHGSSTTQQRRQTAVQ